jgi:hypothetical protein
MKAYPDRKKVWMLSLKEWKMKFLINKIAIALLISGASTAAFAQITPSPEAAQANTNGIRCMAVAVTKLDDSVSDASTVAQAAISQCQGLRDQYLMLLAAPYGRRINMPMQRQNLYQMDLQNVTRFILERRAQQR